MMNYEKAISLAKDGINYDKKDSPGFVNGWYNWLLIISQAQNNTEKTIEYARLLFIDSFRNEKDYYEILKQNVRPENWEIFLEELIQDISKKNTWGGSELIASIFIKEEWWDRLLELVKKTPNIHTIEQYEKYLSKKYVGDMVDLYENAIIEYMKNNVGRNHYQNTCRYIRRIIKLGDRDRANKIILLFRTEYPKRRALMEELSKV